MYQPATQDEPVETVTLDQAAAIKHEQPEIEPQDADVLDPDPITDLAADQPATTPDADDTPETAAE